MLQALIDTSQASVEGEVRLKLYKGNTIVTGRRSPHSLYSMKHVTFEEDQGAYDQVDAPGLHQAERAAPAPRRHGGPPRRRL
jgi:argininosuccinate synthase